MNSLGIRKLKMRIILLYIMVKNILIILIKDLIKYINNIYRFLKNETSISN
jgi:hypothetical protein